jgi:hypothetical protein
MTDTHKFQGTTIWDYFTARLGRGPAHDLHLDQLPLDSICGGDCQKVIDAGAAMLAVVDPALKNDVRQLTEDAVAIYWLG